MKKLESKEKVVAYVKERVSKASFALVTDYRGMTVAELTELRKRLRQNNAECKIAKNTLMKIAVRDTNLKELESLLEGPTALLLSYGEPTECAKILVDYSKEIEKGSIKGGVFEGKLLTQDQIKVFATLPSKEVLIAQIAGLLTANTAGIVGVFEGLIRDIALLAEEVAKKNNKV